MSCIIPGGFASALNGLSGPESGGFSPQTWAQPPPGPPYRGRAPLTAVRFGATRSGQSDKTLARPNAAGDRRQARRQVEEMAPPLLQLKDIALTFGGTPLLTGAELSVATGERVSLVGRNGSGKSTLLKIAAGLVEPDRGTVFVQPGALVRYLAQEPDFAGFATTLAYVEAGLAASDDPYVARAMLEQLGLTGAEDPAHISGGEARRASLARALAPSPDILLLDEPTNHLDLTTIEWLERELDQRRTALVIISHDRRFLSNLTRQTVWLDRGEHAAHRTRLCPFRGMARRAAGRGGTRAAQARPQDRRGRALDALRRHRAAQAQHAPGRRTAGAARAAPRLSRRRRQRRHHGEHGRPFRQAGHRGRTSRQELRRAAPSCAISPPAFSAATASASSAPTAPARPR